MAADSVPSPDAEALFEEAACGLLVTSRNGVIQRVNQTFCRWVGRSADELVGRRKMQELLTMGGRIFHQTHWAPLLQMQGSVAEVKLEVVHADGHTLPMMMNAVSREHGGVVLHELAVFIAEDRNKYERELLMARRRAEELLNKQQQAQQALTLTQERLEMALASTQLFLWDLDVATSMPRFEDKVALLLGHAAPSPVSSKQFALCLHPDDRGRASEALAAALDPAVGEFGVMLRLQGVDGVERTVRATGRSFFDGADRLVQFVGMLQDVTELSRQRAEAEDRALFAEQMIGIVSHDLRNPLTAIQMSALLLSRSSPSANQLRVIDRIASSTARANRLIADLLDFTQARLGRGLKVSVRAVNLHELVSDNVEELAMAFADRQIEHRQQGSGPCLADADRLAQVIGNLVSNAVSYGALDRPITVTSLIHSRGFEVSVHNEGVPVPPELMPDLFKPMTRGSSPGQQARSVGLGLFIVREIVRAHGGDVEAVSTPESGTTFIARFPHATR